MKVANDPVVVTHGNIYNQSNMESNRKQLSADDIDHFKATIKQLCTVLNEIQEKYEPKDDKEEYYAKQTLYDRLMDNNLRAMFVGANVCVSDIDNVVNTLTLMTALFLTIPYGVMTAAGKDYWDWVRVTLAACPTTQFTYTEDFTLFSNTFNAVIYSSISVLIMALLYYLLHPKSEAKFKVWWRYARYVILMMLLGTCCSVISLVVASSWLFSWYIIPTDRLCEYSAKTQAIAGNGVVIACFVVSLICML